MSDDPFGALGLPPRADLTDEDVRAAWRRVAAATHPDRDDGGDPPRFSAAAAAYDTLRTSFGRGEALADLGRRGTPPTRARRRHPGRGAHRVSRPGPLSRYRGYAGQVAAARGPGRRLAGPATASAACVACVACVAATVTVAVAVGWTPATIGLLTGALTWAAWSVAKRPGRWRRGGRDR